MTNPYSAKTEKQFWRTAVADVPVEQVAPLPSKRFAFVRGESIATAGSCFAQNVARYLVDMPDVNFLQPEPNDADQPAYSARYGNIYTVSQLNQLFLEAFNMSEVPPLAVKRADGSWVDGFRPTIFKEGFVTPEEVRTAREEHLSAVRKMFEECSVFIFTLGLVEGWGVAEGLFTVPMPLALVSDDPSTPSCHFRLFTYDEILSTLQCFVSQLKLVNPAVKIILTVSPVPLTATYTDEHVLTASVLGKSVLRAVCAAMETAYDDVFYFPSFEIISSHFNNGKYYSRNKRSVTDEGIEHVMRIFRDTYMSDENRSEGSMEHNDMLRESYSGQVICDEEKFGTNIGF